MRSGTGSTGTPSPVRTGSARGERASPTLRSTSSRARGQGPSPTPGRRARRPTRAFDRPPEPLGRGRRWAAREVPGPGSGRRGRSRATGLALASHGRPAREGRGPGRAPADLECRAKKRRSRGRLEQTLKGRQGVSYRGRRPVLGTTSRPLAEGRTSSGEGGQAPGADLPVPQFCGGHGRNLCGRRRGGVEKGRKALVRGIR